MAAAEGGQAEVVAGALCRRNYNNARKAEQETGPGASLIYFDSANISQSPVKSTILIENKTGKHMAYKFKMTSNKLFLVDLPRGVIPADASRTVTFTYRGSFIPTDLHHYFTFFGAFVSDINVDPKQALDAVRDREDAKRRVFVMFGAAGAQHPQSTLHFSGTKDLKDLSFSVD